MKKIIYLLLLAVLIAACKKKKSDNTPPAQNASSTQNQNCRISKIEPIGGEEKDIEGEEKDPITIAFDYDDKGNLIKVVMTGYLIVTYAYSKKSIVCERKLKDVITETITYGLDDSGRIISAKFLISEKEDSGAESVITENITYKYTADGCLSVVTSSFENETNTYTYTWQNGNMTSITKTSIDKNNKTKDKETTSFQYGAEAFPINFVRFAELNDDTDDFLTKYFGKMPKNLPSRATNRESVEEYAFQKDDKGNVIKFTEVLKTPGKKDETSSVAIYYNCK